MRRDAAGAFEDRALKNPPQGNGAYHNAAEPHSKRHFSLLWNAPRRDTDPDAEHRA